LLLDSKEVTCNGEETNKNIDAEKTDKSKENSMKRT
jgi:hypothetical protein